MNISKTLLRFLGNFEMYFAALEQRVDGDRLFGSALPRWNSDGIRTKGCKYFKCVRSSYIFTRSISENR